MSRAVSSSLWADGVRCEILLSNALSAAAVSLGACVALFAVLMATLSNSL